MSNETALGPLSSFLIEKSYHLQEKFFNSNLILELNKFLKQRSISCTMSVLDESMQSMKTLIWSNLEEENPPYREFIKTDKFQQYIMDSIRNTELSPKQFRMFAGRDFFSLDNYDEEPYIRFLQENYPSLSLKYCVKVPMGKHRNYWLNLFKKSWDGDFDTNDMQLIDSVCGMVISAYNAYEYNRENWEKTEIINKALENFSAGLITFDKNKNPRTFMGISKNIIHGLTGCVRMSEAFQSLVNQIHNNGKSEKGVYSALLREYKCYMMDSGKGDNKGFILMFPHPDPVRSNFSVEFSSLTNREKEVAKCLAEGYSYKDVSDELFISISTVRNHVTNIYRKLNINNQRQLIALYFGQNESHS